MEKETGYNPEKVPAIFAHIVRSYFSPVTAILEKSIPGSFLEKQPLKDFKTAVKENLDRGAINEEQVKELLSETDLNTDFIDQYDNFINKFQKIALEDKIDEYKEELEKEMNDILNKIEEQK